MPQHEYQLRKLDEAREIQQIDRSAPPPTRTRPSTAGSIRGGHILAFHDEKGGSDIGLFQTRGESESSKPLQGISGMLRARKKKQPILAKLVSPQRNPSETFYPSAIESSAASKHPSRREAFTKYEHMNIGKHQFINSECTLVEISTNGVTGCMCVHLCVDFNGQIKENERVS
jgi:hypothetical protein